MLYINQLDHPDIPYVHMTSLPNGPVTSSVARSGCGLCSACMMISELTLSHLSIEDAVKLSESIGANIIAGTRMSILGPHLAKTYGLAYKCTGDINEALECLKAGGRVIINVGGDHDDHIGIYCYTGHYILAVGYDGEELCILDPMYEEGKFDKEGIKGKVRVPNAPFTYCTPEVIVDDTRNRETPYYLFRRKK